MLLKLSCLTLVGGGVVALPIYLKDPNHKKEEIDMNKYSLEYSQFVYQVKNNNFTQLWDDVREFWSSTSLWLVNLLPWKTNNILDFMNPEDIKRVMEKAGIEASVEQGKLNCSEPATDKKINATKFLYCLKQVIGNEKREIEKEMLLALGTKELLLLIEKQNTESATTTEDPNIARENSSVQRTGTSELKITNTTSVNPTTLQKSKWKEYFDTTTNTAQPTLKAISDTNPPAVTEKSFSNQALNDLITEINNQPYFKSLLKLFKSNITK